MLLGLRGDSGATTDVDSITELPAPLQQAAAQAAAESGLPTTWINTRSRAFAVNNAKPTTIVYQSAKLRIRSAAADDIFIMKIAVVTESCLFRIVTPEM